MCFLCETQKYVEILNSIWIIIFYIGIFSAILSQDFASFTPAVGSMTTLLLEIMGPRYAFVVKHKNMLKYWIIFELLHFI